MGQVRWRVDAEHVFRFRGEMSNGESIRRCQSDHVGQVLFALSVAAPDAGQGGEQKGGLQAVDAAVDLAHGFLARRGIPLFDDADDVARVAPHNAAVARGIIQARRQHRKGRLLLPVCIEQAAQGRGAQQRHVAAQHQNVAVEVS